MLWRRQLLLQRGQAKRGQAARRGRYRWQLPPRTDHGCKGELCRALWHTAAVGGPGSGQVAAALSLAALWESLWPVAVGVILALLLRGPSEALPRVPEGDVAALIDPATQASLRIGAGLDRLDGLLRGWTVASIGLVVIAVAIGIALRPG